MFAYFYGLAVQFIMQAQHNSYCESRHIVILPVILLLLPYVLPKVKLDEIKYLLSQRHAIPQIMKTRFLP